MLPVDVMIKSVDIYQATNDVIIGFKFFYKDHKLIFRIGCTGSLMKFETVVLADNEVIIGVVAKLWGGYQSSYSDF
jgi:hypothetical protein